MTYKVLPSIDELLNLEEKLPCQYHDWDGHGCKSDVAWITSGHLNCETVHGIFLCNEHHAIQLEFDKKRNHKCSKCGSPGLMFNDRRI